MWHRESWADDEKDKSGLPRDIGKLGQVKYRINLGYPVTSGTFGKRWKCENWAALWHRDDGRRDQDRKWQTTVHHGMEEGLNQKRVAAQQTGGYVQTYLPTTHTMFVLVRVYRHTYWPTSHTVFDKRSFQKSHPQCTSNICWIIQCINISVCKRSYVSLDVRIRIYMTLQILTLS